MANLGTFHHLTSPIESRNAQGIEAVVQRCSVKKVFLEILQNSQENTCARFSFSIILFIRKTDSGTGLALSLRNTSGGCFWGNLTLVQLHVICNNHEHHIFFSLVAHLQITEFSNTCFKSKLWCSPTVWQFWRRFQNSKLHHILKALLKNFLRKANDINFPCFHGNRSRRLGYPNIFYWDSWKK